MIFLRRILWLLAGPATVLAGPESHWAFQPVRRPPVPEVRDRSWVQNPIDAFLLAKLEAAGEKPASPASAGVLLRRAHLDLLGLPPAVEEIDAFASAATTTSSTVAPEDNHALDRLVDGLLSRPAYGERWARHWLDLVRYADSNGYERDAAKPFVWRYRDYVIRSLNDDKPFDRFITEQIAGDELEDATAETIIATGFLRLGHWDDEPADPAADRFDQLDDIVRTTSGALLGLTLGCARCHDHKFEPLSQRDYYSMLAVFTPLERPRDGRTEKTVPTGDPAIPEAYAWTEKSATPPATFILRRGNPGNPGEEVGPALPVILTKHQSPVPFPRSGERTSRRRLGLAQWLTSGANPLTARVLVNRVWQQHFGEGLVRTPGDFGVMGDKPSNPELLDWLAAWFVHEADWSLKKLHHLILTSSAWQQSGRPPQRLEAEAIRDSMLWVSGRLNPAMFGPPVFPPVPRGALEGNSDPDKVWPASPQKDASRRSIYVFLKRSLIMPMFEELDLSDTINSCPRRQTTTVSPQALTLFNSEFTMMQARAFAERLKVEAGADREAQLTRAFQLALGRVPSASERAALRSFLETDSLEEVCRVIFNLNEFVYPD